MKHTFGGLWTRKKLEVLEKYLKFYTTALKNMHLNLHYVDAFAGTGSQDPKVIESQGEIIPSEDFHGSVKTALEIEPGFNHYHFNDLNPDHIKELESIQLEHPSKNIHITQRDANLFVPDFCKTLKNADRAVLFLDPYSTQLDWDTLRYVAASKKIDLWMLFPISALTRMTPRDHAKIRPEWSGTITRLLGTDEWENALYKPDVMQVTGDFFDDTDEAESAERLNVDELEGWITKRLRETFCYVAKPYRLTNKNSPLFTFYFAVSNPNEKAWRLADRAVTSILKNQH